MNVMSGADSPRIGVALGGGSARGLAHIPFIEAMDELGLRPAVIAGTSIGALVGAGWAAGLKGAEIREHSIDALGTMRSITRKLWFNSERRPNLMGWKKISLQFDAEQVIEAFMPGAVPQTFEELRTPLHVIASDFHSWNQVVFDTGPVRPAVAGSIAIPSFFRPVRYNGRVLIDGGVVDPLPLDAASANVDILIGIDVNGDPNAKRGSRPPSAIDVWMGAAQIMMHQLTAHMIAAYPPDIYIRPHLSEFGAYEFWKVRQVIAKGDLEKERFKKAVANRVEDFIAAQRRNL